MTKFLSILLLLNFNYALANKVKKNSKIEETKKVLKALLPFQGKSKNSSFKIDQCKIDKNKWTMLLLAKQSFTEKLNFNKGCHVEGQYTTKMETPFPVNFKLKNLKNFEKVNFNFLIKLIYEPVPMIKVFMNNGTLKGKKDIIKFDVDYSAEIDPLSKGFIKKDLGGNIVINSINGKKIKQKIPIKR